jgi:DNA polymerase II
VSEEQRDEGVRAFLLHVFHRQHKGRDVIYAVGRLQSGETFGLMDQRAKPAFYVREIDRDVLIEELSGERAELVEVSLATLDGAQVVRVECDRVGGLRRLAKRLEERGVRTYEADVNFALHYLMERGLRGSLRLRGKWQQGQGVDRVYVDPEIEPIAWQPDLSLLVLDIETAPDASEVYAASLVGGRAGGEYEVEEIHIVGASAAGDPENLICHADERALLKALGERVREIDPDILSGWNVIDFDLAVLQKRFEAHKLVFNLGRTQDASWFRESDTWGGSRMVVYGRQILDALHLMRATLQRFDDYRLGTVAQAILGRGKTLQPEDDETMPEAIVHAYAQDRRAFCEYCLEDSRLVWDMLKAEGLIELSLRRALLTGLPLERSWGSVAAFDIMYISELRRRFLVAPTTGVDRTRGRGAPGGLVMEPHAGLYSHVFVFDFKSLYPSIMRTFNIDPLSHARAAEDAEAIEAPNGARFSRERGILPDLLETFWASREEAKARGDALASYAYKIIMNSFYGVLATGSCRFAADELAGAITEFGHYILRWTKELLESEFAPCRVLYGDTDSVFVDPVIAVDSDAGFAQQRGGELCAAVNKKLSQHLEEVYGIESRLELEFEKHYARFLLPPMRGSEKGRAKGYAGWRMDDKGGHLEIVGMEAVRRDWTALAHALQRRLLELLFRGAGAEEIEACVSECVRSLRAGERDADLVYLKNLRKPVSSYTRNVPPHVQAAKMLAKPRGVIHYVITCEGPQPLGHLRAEPDYDHYVKKQIEPLVRTIAQVCPIDVEAAIKGVGNLFAADVWAGTKGRVVREEK